MMQIPPYTICLKVITQFLLLNLLDLQPESAFGYRDHALPPLVNMTQANFFFKRQKATAETSTIPQEEPIRIKPRSKVCLNV
jgi:hypothetical protein